MVAHGNEWLATLRRGRHSAAERSRLLKEAQVERRCAHVCQASAGRAAAGKSVEMAAPTEIVVPAKCSPARCVGRRRYRGARRRNWTVGRRTAAWLALREIRLRRCRHVRRTVHLRKHEETRRGRRRSSMREELCRRGRSAERQALDVRQACGELRLRRRFVRNEAVCANACF